MSALLGAVGVLALIVLTATMAVFVAAEFSLTALDRSQIDAHVEAVGDQRSRRVQRAHRTLSFQLSGAQLGITITTLLTGFVAEPALATLLAPGLTALGLPPGAATGTALLLALVLATALSMVFGELVPKNLAIARPLPTARAVAGIQTRFSATFRWVIAGLNNSANWIVQRLGVEPAEVLRSARSAEELMTPRVKVESLRADATVADLVTLAVRTGFSRFPVHEGDLDQIRGVVHVKQIFGIPAGERDRRQVASLARPALTVPESLDGDALLDRLRGSGLQFAVVVDEYGGTAGIVTLEDLVEEIVGDVRDEHDRLEANPVRPL